MRKLLLALVMTAFSFGTLAQAQYAESLDKTPEKTIDQTDKGQEPIDQPGKTPGQSDDDQYGRAPADRYDRDGRTPIWTCNMKFAGEAHGLQVIFGRFTLNARGTIYCWNPLGGTRTIPVLVTMKSGIVSPNVSAGKFHFVGRSLDLSLGNLSPEKLLGRYRVAHARGAFIGGAGAITGVKVGIPQLALKVSIEFDSGFGFSVGLNRMMITLDESRIH